MGKCLGQRVGTISQRDAGAAGCLCHHKGVRTNDRTALRGAHRQRTIRKTAACKRQLLHHQRQPLEKKKKKGKNKNKNAPSSSYHGRNIEAADINWFLHALQSHTISVGVCFHLSLSIYLSSVGMPFCTAFCTTYRRRAVSYRWRCCFLSPGRGVQLAHAWMRRGT